MQQKNLYIKIKDFLQQSYICICIVYVYMYTWRKFVQMFFCPYTLSLIKIQNEKQFFDSQLSTIEKLDIQKQEKVLFQYKGVITKAYESITIIIR